MERAKEFVQELYIFKNNYGSIKNAQDHDAAKDLALNYGVNDSDIPADATPALIADIYLNKKTMYKSEAELG